MESVIAINDLDITSVMTLAYKRKKRYLAITLNEVEEIWKKKGLSIEDPEFKFLRKAILDNVNELVRALLRDIVGGVEDGYGVM